MNVDLNPAEIRDLINLVTERREADRLRMQMAIENSMGVDRELAKRLQRSVTIEAALEAALKVGKPAEKYAERRVSDLARAAGAAFATLEEDAPVVVTVLDNRGMVVRENLVLLDFDVNADGDASWLTITAMEE